MKKRFKVFASKDAKKRTRIVASYVWGDPHYDRMVGQYLPSQGEGNTMATQLATALNKLIYKWYNDGDVYDNRFGMEGFANDISSHANWIYKHFPNTRKTLEKIYRCTSESQYVAILAELASLCWDDEDLENLDKKPKIDSIYNCDGPFECDYDNDSWDEEYGDEDYDESDY